MATDTDSVVGRAEMMLMMSCVRRRITVVRAMLLLLLLHLDSEVDRFTLQLNASARHLRLYSRPTLRFIATQNKAIVDIRLRPQWRSQYAANRATTLPDSQGPLLQIVQIQQDLGSGEEGRLTVSLCFLSTDIGLSCGRLSL